MGFETRRCAPMPGCFVLAAFAGVAITYAGQPAIQFSRPAMPAHQATTQARVPQTPDAARVLAAADPPPRPDALLAPTATLQTPAGAPQFGRPSAPTPSFGGPLVNSPLTNQTRPSLGFYNSYAARAALSQMPRRTPIRSAPAPPLPRPRQVKPFQTIHHDPTVSPYLNLYRNEEDNEAAPNYFAFVRPQIDQLEENRMQQRAIQHLRGQVQAVSSTIATPAYQSPGLPGTGTPARYMDTAQFYGGWRK